MKNKTVAAALAIFLGGVGLHHFYLGNTLRGCIYLLTCWTGIPAIIGLVEGIIYLFISEEKFQTEFVKRK